MEIGSTNRSQSSKNPSVMSSESTDSRPETSVTAQPEMDESFQADRDAIPLENEFENVDVGAGPPGGVAIVNPGRDVVNDRYSIECLQQRRNSSRKYPSQKLGETDRQSNKSGHRGDELDSLQVDLGNPDSVPEVKHSRIGNILGRRSREKKKDGEIMSGEGGDLSATKGLEVTTDLEGGDLLHDSASPSSPGTKTSKTGHFWGRRGGSQKKDAPTVDASRDKCLEETTELVLQGPKGTEVHTNLKISEDDVEELGKKSPEDGTGSPPDELHSGDSDDLETDHRMKSASGNVKKMGKGVLATAHHIGHGFRKLTPR